MYKEKEHVGSKKVHLSKSFYLLVSSGSLSRAGTTAFSISILWITLALTNSALIAGLADGLFTFPLIFSFYFGAIIDRSERKKDIMVGSTLLRAGAVLLIFIAVLIHVFVLIILLIYFCVIITGTMSDIQNSVRSVWTKSFLNEGQYQRGTSLMNGSISLAEGVGYAISGILLYLGYMYAVILLASISLISLIPVILLKEKKQETDKTSERSVRKDMLEGISFIRKNRSLRQLIIIMIFANFVIAMIGIGFTFTVEEVFRIPAFYLSLIFIALSVGIAGGSIPGSLIRGSLGPVIVPLLAFAGVLFISIGYVNEVLVFAAMVFGIGFSIGIINSVAETVFIRKVPSGMMARISGAVNTFALSATFLSGTMAGVIIEFFTIRSLFLIIGTATIFAGILIIFMKDFYRERIDHATNVN